MPIQVAFISQDLKLKSMLTSVLGQEVALAASDIDRACELASDSPVDAVIFDLDDLPRSYRGEPQADRFGEILGCGIPVIILADDERRRDALELVERGAYGYIRKPPVIRELRAMLRGAYERRSLKGELIAARRQLENSVGLDQLTGSSAPMQLVYKLVRKVASLDAPVLITGESGTGKELIARAIHNVGNRAKRPFIAVSCGAIPDALMEAELFGHEKGAFTGSIGAREGYFERAGDGTLFLDEIGELNLPTQVKLLRVLQQREFGRLGSSRSVPLRARIIFATHRDLEHMMAEGGFRQDLFYRVNVMKIASPALRHHAGDIPSLVHHFLRQYSTQYGKPVEAIEPEALELLQRYSWPGNVRELENVMQRAIIMAEGSSIDIADLPDVIRDQDPPDFEDGPAFGTFERLLRDYKFKLASDAVEQCHGNKTMAAQSLSISRAYLHRLLRQAPGAAESNVTEFNPPRDSERIATLSLAAAGQ
jgi:DNA-binding NtrC family response regulator